MDAPFYEQAAVAEGWIVLATDANIRPIVDSVAWRLATLAAGLQAIRKEWPQFAQWPVAFAGFSGGAKCSAELGPILVKSGTVKICGFFLAGINTDPLSKAYKTYHLPPDLLNVPIWLSSGTSDQIASPGKHENVRLSLQHAGFKRVRLEAFDGGHEVDPAEVQRALRWFRELGKF
jgi:predicted esterase